MVIIDFAGGEYNAAANTLQQVSGELQGANIDDLSEAVESSMKGADSIATATRIEGRYISLLISHSRALEELARAAHAAGVNLAQTEANNTQQAKAQGQAALAGTAGATPSLAIYAEQASALNLDRGCRLMRQLLLCKVLFLTHRPLQLLWRSDARPEGTTMALTLRVKSSDTENLSILVETSDR